MKEFTKREQKFQILTYFCLALSLVSTITYMIYTILSSNNIINQIFSIICVIALATFSLLYVIMGMFAKSKKIKVFLIIGSLLLSFYSITNTVIGITAVKDFVLDFTNKDIKEVVAWAEERNILIEQEFQYSDTISQYKIISQSVEEGTPTKKLDKLRVVVSDGIDPSIRTEVTSMIGWKLDDVITFVDENHLTNVTIEFEFSNTIKKDIIIRQDVIREITREEPVTLVSSLGKESELKSVTMENLVGLDTFHALIYCGRNHLNCSIQYAYSEDKEEGIVLKQSIKKWEVISSTENKEIILTVAKRNQITVPDLLKMSASEITIWATNNRLKIEFSEEYDDSIKIGKVISTSPIKGAVVAVDDTIKVTLSKGQLRMIPFTTIDEFRDWADENEVGYHIDYQFSDTVENGKLISSSHSSNQIIKNKDIINLVISQGGKTTIPNLLEMKQEDAVKSCNKANIKCKFIYLDNNTSYTIVTKQSMRSGSNVPINTTVTITLGK